ncbi:hypothetical protein B0A52_10369 [Exophiala mesophila]|uniref:Protein BNI4 n=1 Tax=Exophiala mesophila TaxID=212818 RepID=A0A438MRS2_EXOME|nr:hypothetical protein B0A52_10369 [Exophiala mesophila]
MAALVQTLPMHTSTVTMIGRPSSAGGYSPQPAQQHMRSHTSPNARYHNMSTGYRGTSAPGPVAPYAFTSTPQLASSSSRAYGITAARPVSTLQTTSQPSSPTEYLPPVDAGNRLSLGLSNFSSATSFMAPPQPPSPSTTKPSPDRYRRTLRRMDGESGPNRVAATSPGPAGSTAPAGASLYSHPSQTSSTPSLTSQNSYRGSAYGASSSARNSNDDIHVGRPQADLAARYRRRSLGNLDTAGLNHTSDGQDTASPHPNAFLNNASPYNAQPQSRQSGHSHTASSESITSSRSNRSSRPGSATRPESPHAYTSPSIPNQPTGLRQEGRLAAHARSTDSSIRQPSPLSRPVDLSGQNTASKPEAPSLSPLPPPASSAAVEQLAALSLKDNKNKKSKLRRAFSFGSAAELRKVTAQNNHEKSMANRTPLQAKRSSKYEDELEPEQARIAEKQEAAGLGESIYSGQGQFFTGSTDNLSISSTASSASIMLRKMGKGVKKGTRSLVGLFRPKSVIGVPAADEPLNEAPVAAVSMVTVEAEREKINVNVNPHDQVGGGTGFPKLERNSVDAKLSFDSTTISSDTRSRRSIVGGEKERAEVLAAVKKGILKRNDSNQASPKIKAYDYKAPDFNLPQIPHVNDSPRSSAPSTPVDDEAPRSGHRRTDSITIESNDHDDYFSSVRLGSIEAKNISQGLLRNISFSPRIQFHDTWPSGEYDRRGDIATCNRLTPMLAQQIKEELNTFKMEMEVHESSKVYTHFF